MPEMKALAAMYFNGVVLKGDKASHVGGLQKLMEEQPTVLTTAAANIKAATTVATAPTAVITATADDSDADDLPAVESLSDLEDEHERAAMEHAHLFAA